jgi:tetratricopeptide (TPR) repeat protein
MKCVLKNYIAVVLVVSLTVALGSGSLVAQAKHNRQFVRLSHQAVTEDNFVFNHLASVMDAMPGRRSAILLMGIAHLFNKDTQTQIKILDLIMSSNFQIYLPVSQLREMVRMLSYQSETLYEQEQWDELLAQAEKMLILIPDCVEGLTWKGTAIGYLQQSELADIYLDRAVTLYPDSIFVLTRAAHYYLFYSPGRALQHKAWTLLQQAFLLDSSDESVLWMSATYLMGEGRCSEARYFGQRNVDLYPMSANAWYTLGNVLWVCDLDKDQARAAYSRAVELKPELKPYVQDKLTTP